ncbi:MAG: regulatory protein RecX [Oscillochloris sp.]|nr:regulatory protein RecX [Oscillochloris sp.]
MPTGKVTAIRAQQRNSQRVSLFIDGEFALGVSLNTLAHERIAVGSEIDEEAWIRLEQVEQADQALQAAARQLEVRPRSVAELRTFLRRKQHPPEAIEHAVTRLTELGLLNDAAFSQVWIENRRSFRPRGTQALRAELQRKGVQRTVIDAALAADPSDPEDERRQAEELARSRLDRYRTCADYLTFQRRLGGFLMRRGYSGEIVHPIISQLWAELSDS